MTESRSVNSNQQGPHLQLEKVVRRHLNSRFRRPFADFSQRTFDAIDSVVSRHSGPLIIDSYCGVGESTLHLARENPEALVIGIDKSLHRLDKHDREYRANNVDNYRLVRADVDDLWRLALQAGWQPVQHYLLYPNPWPKSAHLKRRCHGSPLFPTLLALGGVLELRSNWATYVEEFALAVKLAGYPAQTERYSPSQPITPFERKYHASGQALWRCTVIASPLENA